MPKTGTGNLVEMRNRRQYSLAAVLLAALAYSATASTCLAQRYVATADSLYPRIKYADSLVSANDRCMVAQRKLNLRVRPVYVNGVPMGFC